MDQFWSMIGAGGLSIVGVWVGGWMTRRTQTESFYREVSEQRAEKFRVALGEVTALARELIPERIGLSVGSHSEGLLADYKARQEEVKPDLLGHSLTDPNEHVREATINLVSEIEGVFHWLGWLIHDLLSDQGKTTGMPRQEANAHYDEIQPLLETISAEVRKRAE